ncbi:MAG: DUF4395 domain-containing protein [Euzebya sp.]
MTSEVRSDMTSPELAPRRIDVRGPRFSAALTFAVLATAFLLQTPVLVGIQVIVFAIASIAGLKYSPYGNVFRVVRKRYNLGPATQTEPEAGPRFSQTMGLIFSGAGLIALLSGATALGWGLVLVVVALSALLALTGICVGCEVHALGQRLRGGA